MYRILCGTIRLRGKILEFDPRNKKTSLPCDNEVFGCNFEQIDAHGSIQLEAILFASRWSKLKDISNLSPPIKRMVFSFVFPAYVTSIL